MMKSPVVIVSAALTVAILLAASFLIAAGTRGENVLTRTPARAVLTSPIREMTTESAPAHDHL